MSPSMSTHHSTSQGQRLVQSRTRGLRALALVFISFCASHVLAFDLQAHRGGRGLWPENTLLAFGNAIRLGVTTLELDVGVTADGHVVISHDPNLNPNITRGPSGQWLSGPGPNIWSLSYAHLSGYDVGRINPNTKYAADFAQQQGSDGVRIPRLSDLFELAKQLGATDIEFHIETKIDPRFAERTLSPEAFVAALLKTVREAGVLSRVTVQSFDWRTLAELRRVAPQVRTTYLTSDLANLNTLADGAWTLGLTPRQYGGSVAHMVLAAAGKATAVTWSPHFRSLTADQVRSAQALGLRVVPWTVNRPSDMQALIAMGVDGLITDFPDLLRGAMQAANLSLPSAPMAVTPSAATRTVPSPSRQD